MHEVLVLHAEIGKRGACMQRCKSFTFRFTHSSMARFRPLDLLGMCFLVHLRMKINENSNFGVPNAKQKFTITRTIISLHLIAHRLLLF